MFSFPSASAGSPHPEFAPPSAAGLPADALFPASHPSVARRLPRGSACASTGSRSASPPSASPGTGWRRRQFPSDLPWLIPRLGREPISPARAARRLFLLRLASCVLPLLLVLDAGLEGGQFGLHLVVGLQFGEFFLQRAGAAKVVGFHPALRQIDAPFHHLETLEGFIDARA